MEFSEKLELAMKKMSLSRAGLAAAVGVDKSVAGRWVAGKVRPSSHNLSKISRLIAKELPGFTMLDWEREPNEFAKLFGANAVSAGFGDGTIYSMLPAKLAEEAKHAATQRSKAYEGFWRSTRPSSDLPGQFLHDVAMVRCNQDGFLAFESGVEGFYYSGTSVVIHQQVYYFGADDGFGAITMGVFNGVSRQRAEVLDGVLLTTLRDAGASPTASSIIMHRIDDISDDIEADTVKFRKLVENQKLVAEPGSIDPEIVEHLHGAANAPGMLRMLFAQSMSRGPILTG